jgi:hypothetical protein
LVTQITAELERLSVIDRQRKEIEAQKATIERMVAEQQARAAKQAEEQARIRAEELALSKPSKSVAEEMHILIEVGYKARARVQHPDRGGTTEGMQMVNAAVERLRAQL